MCLELPQAASLHHLHDAVERLAARAKARDTDDILTATCEHCSPTLLGTLAPGLRSQVQQLDSHASSLQMYMSGTALVTHH
jgi:hypothetical protein